MQLVKVPTPVTPPKAFVLAQAQPRHLEQVAALWHAAWQDGHLGNVPADLLPHRTLAEFRRRTAARLDHMTVALDHQASGSPVVGFHVVDRDEVEQLFVDAGWRGTGVAAALLAHAERTIAARHPAAWLAVAPGNARARRFYERCGWRDAGAFDNPADIDGGTVLVPTRRYEKPVRQRPERAL
jgi:GNAT superfamily N-acetyltransferase